MRPIFFALSLFFFGCQTVGTAPDLSKPTLKSGDCIGNPGDEGKTPTVWVLDIGKTHYAIANTLYIQTPSGFAIPIEKVEQGLANGEIVVIDCYPVVEQPEKAT